ncbi:MAG: tRNA (guanine(26)-N(2))-dimethyltransferase [Halobacteriaceae archaeon]
MRVREGGVEVEAPEQSGEGKEGEVFFNERMELNRDITVAALRAHRERAGGGTYLDATAATGIRGVRAAADGWDVTLADVDPEAVALCEANLARNNLSGEVRHRDAKALLYGSRGFDVVDIDPFGTPVPFAAAALRNARDLVCVTATDTAPLCGAHFRSGVRRYGAVPRNTEYHAEMGLRVLLGALARTAASHDVGVTPLLSHASDHYVRTYLALDRGATPANGAVDALGHVYHCPECLYREADPGLVADPPTDCPHCGSDQLLAAGPLWLAAAHDPGFVAATRDRLDDGMGTRERASDLLDRIEGELDTPTHYDQHRLTKRWNEPAPAMDEFLDSLRGAGHRASRTHYGGTTFKTDSSVAEIAAAVRA